MKTLFFDTETTGLPFQLQPEECGRCLNDNGYPRLIQLGWIFEFTEDETSKATVYPSQGSVYIRPDGFVIPEETTKFNGIRNDYACAVGGNLKDVLQYFGNMLANADVVVGHNVEFDLNVLKGEYAYLRQNGMVAEIDKKSAEGKVIDTMLASTAFCALPKKEGVTYSYEGEHKYPRLSELHRILFGEDFSDAHDALADVKATRRCYEELVRRGIIRKGAATQ